MQVRCEQGRGGSKLPVEVNASSSRGFTVFTEWSRGIGARAPSTAATRRARMRPRRGRYSFLKDDWVPSQGAPGGE